MKTSKLITFDQMLAELLAGNKVQGEDWEESAFIFRVPGNIDDAPSWMIEEIHEHNLTDRSVYDEEFNEVYAVTLTENLDSLWRVVG